MTSARSESWCPSWNLIPDSLAFLTEDVNRWKKKPSREGIIRSADSVVLCAWHRVGCPGHYLCGGGVRGPLEKMEGYTDISRPRDNMVGYTFLRGFLGQQNSHVGEHWFP